MSAIAWRIVHVSCACLHRGGTRDPRETTHGFHDRCDEKHLTRPHTPAFLKRHRPHDFTPATTSHRNQQDGLQRSKEGPRHLPRLRQRCHRQRHVDQPTTRRCRQTTFRQRRDQSRAPSPTQSAPTYLTKLSGVQGQAAHRTEDRHPRDLRPRDQQEHTDRAFGDYRAWTDIVPAQPEQALAAGAVGPTKSHTFRQEGAAAMV